MFLAHITYSVHQNSLKHFNSNIINNWKALINCRGWFISDVFAKTILHIYTQPSTSWFKSHQKFNKPSNCFHKQIFNEIYLNLLSTGVPLKIYNFTAMISQKKHRWWSPRSEWLMIIVRWWTAVWNCRVLMNLSTNCRGLQDNWIK